MDYYAYVLDPSIGFRCDTYNIWPFIGGGKWELFPMRCPSYLIFCFSLILWYGMQPLQQNTE